VRDADFIRRLAGTTNAPVESPDDDDDDDDDDDTVTTRDIVLYYYVDVKVVKGRRHRRRKAERAPEPIGHVPARATPVPGTPDTCHH